MTPVMEEMANACRKHRWDSFLDHYSAYLREPTPMHAIDLKLAAAELEKTDPSFSRSDFEQRLGWSA